ncbi:MAG TPA: DedA family protein [Synergistales bacterium]|jgi:membrane protein DedA with SNARE-associated domain|nr:DedA family protein [Synergistales bacterium]HRV71720.1 DedA family protein [Thermovirgaceae bacterium]
MFSAIIAWIVATIGRLGYPGVVALMFLESSFFPFPSEVVVPPAGYLASRGEMNLWLVIAAGIAGSILGALFNYWISLTFGRPFFRKFGKYVFVSEKALDRADEFFAKHGHISTFIGRLLPGIRQLISLPAGLARMNIPLFLFFTTLGSGIWVVILAFVGFWVGNNQELVHQYMHTATYISIAACAVLGTGYVIHYKRKNKRAGNPQTTDRKQ